MVTDDRSRAQIILIGAIALAFIILGVVVVFNGVLYTETLSSGTSSQSASTADVTTTEVEQSVGCMLAILDNDVHDESYIEGKIDELGDHYRTTNARATPTVVDITADRVTFNDPTTGDINEADVIVTYDSHDLSYKQTQTISPNDCRDDDL